ncbi:MAG: M48 family metallopeptidase [Terriglobales bacterium]
MQTAADPQAEVEGIPVANAKTAKKLKAEDNVYLIGHRDVGKGLDFYSHQKEIALGQSLAQQVLQNSKVITDPVVNEYINRLAQNLVRDSDAKVPFQVHVLQDDTINAFALPGGYFFVNSGIILACKEEDELAGAMAHEIAHVAARHGTRNATKGELMSLLTIPAEILAGPGLGGLGAEMGASAIIPLQMERFTRGDEQEADWLGTQYLWKAGYDPYGLPRAFEIIEAEEKQQPGLISRLYASHPATAHRIAITEREIQTIIPPRPSYVVTTSEFAQVQARLRALIKSKVETGVTIPGGVPAPQSVPNPGGPPVIRY